MRGDQNTLQGSAASMPKRRDGSWRPVTMGAGAKGAARLHNVPASPLSTMKPDVGAQSPICTEIGGNCGGQGKFPF